MLDFTPASTQCAECGHWWDVHLVNRGCAIQILFPETPCRCPLYLTPLPNDLQSTDLPATLPPR